jgi:hypothetical protein
MGRGGKGREGKKRDEIWVTFDLMPEGSQAAVRPLSVPWTEKQSPLQLHMIKKSPQVSLGHVVVQSREQGECLWPRWLTVVGGNIKRPA